MQPLAKGILAPGARKLIANKQTLALKPTRTPHNHYAHSRTRSGAHQSFSFHAAIAGAAAASAAAAEFFGNSIHLCNFHLNYSYQKCHGERRGRPFRWVWQALMAQTLRGFKEECETGFSDGEKYLFLLMNNYYGLCVADVPIFS